MNAYVIDTVALVRYLEDNLPKKASEIFSLAEKNAVKLVIPSIVIGEFFYLLKSGRLKPVGLMPSASEILSVLYETPFFQVVDMEFPDWQAFLALELPELHDRMICAVAASRKAVGIVTSDAEITNQKPVPVIWK